MLTNFNVKKNLEKIKHQTSSQNGPLGLLTEAILGVLNENTERVYIDDYPYFVDFKLPKMVDLDCLLDAVNKNQVEFLEAVVVGDEILVHYFQLLPSMRNVEVWYKPISRPRL